MNLGGIREYLAAEIGLDASSLGCEAVDHAIAGRMKAGGFTDPAGYMETLHSSHAEREALFRAISVPETWFMREKEAFVFLRRLVREEWLSHRPIRVLCVPCCTGEEAWSIAITLAEAGLTPGEARVVAVDLCREYVETARAGLYGRNSFRGCAQQNMGAMVEHVGDGYRVNPSLAGYMEWRTGNLVEPLFLAGHGQFDAIFCRNLFIYLKPEMRMRAMKAIDALLAPWGALFMGACETPPGGWLRGAAPPSAFAFVRAAAVQAVAPAVVKAHQAVPRPAQRPALVPPAKGETEAVKVRGEKANAVDVDRARDLADTGRLDDAMAILDGVIGAAPACTEACFLMGVVRECAGDIAGAQKMFERALYLDDHHAEAILRLALIAGKRGDAAAEAALRRRLSRIRDDRSTR